jgi:hypothetical protein
MTQHEGGVELIHAVAPMGIAINFYVPFLDFCEGRSGGSTEIDSIYSSIAELIRALEEKFLMLWQVLPVIVKFLLKNLYF